MGNVLDYGAKGDGRTDDTAALTHAIQRGEGRLILPRGDYLIRRPLYVPLQQVGRFALEGAGGTARILMAGAGPALHLVGSHGRTANPRDFTEPVWNKERFPILENFEIVGQDPQADGIRIEGVMQATLRGVLIRQVRHGIHLTQSDRNVLIEGCHIYHNTGVGVFMDRVNLHQINIVGNHISYCKEAGIKVVGSEIRNIQIDSNDIEYNYDLMREDCADVYFDCREGTVREGTLVGNTVQASPSPGGANVRFIGANDHPNAVGLFAITGNLLGSQTTNVDLKNCRGVVISGNCIYSGTRHSLHAEGAEHLVVGANSIDHNPQNRNNSTDQIVLKDCRGVNLTGIVFQHTREPTVPVETSLLVENCQNVNVVGMQILNARRRGVWVRNSLLVRISDCTLRGREGDADYRVAIAVDKDCTNVMVSNNFLGKGSEGELLLPNGTGSATGNVAV